MEVDCTNH